uniref:J domain-containing protein n=1 Tax=Amphora coffeiformis TaxID=265554 RepID=A0A7S3P9S9_9STRA|mmetsp:Transcript_9165/g.17476  ORF Transcript_9165/g.17476 Transcript_9165/m.17476 type:complete len:328 (-) Transcript_9165:148-1131(-)
MGKLPLDAINEAFGPTADLYRDVLGVKSNASADQIQAAYFDRRNQLFQLLAELEASPTQNAATATKRLQAERKMDAIVMTLRILGDAETRSQYDDVRAERCPSRAAVGLAAPKGKAEAATTKRRTFNMEEGGESATPTKPKSPKSVLKKSSYNITVLTSDAEDSKDTTFDEMDEDDAPSPSRNSASAVSFGTEAARTHKTRKNKRKARRVSPDEPRKGTGPHKKKPSEVSQNLDDSFISGIDPETDAESEAASQVSFRTMETTLTTYEMNRGYFETIRDEIVGALDDTAQSFHQIFSVFTLREDEINAVTGRIDKARRQMVHSMDGK